MAARFRSVFITLTRDAQCRRRNLHRSFTSSSEVVREDPLNFREEEEKEAENGDDLKSRIFRIGVAKRSVTNILQRWVGEGRAVSISDLRHISKELRKSRRFKHALEISEWMVGHNESELSDSDYAIRIDLMAKVFGIDAAERYFEGLPPGAKSLDTYTALLHSYAAAKLTEKAEDLCQRMKSENLALSALSYNELMTLYMSLGQLEKVPIVVEELKSQKVSPDLFTYNLWISSRAAALDINEVRRILSEMRSNPNSNESWERYVNLVNIYISSSQLVNSDSSSLVESGKGDTQREWITYDLLIILYAALGNKEKLDQIWKSLRMTKQKMTSRNYLCILSSYLMLGHVNEVSEIIDQWKQSATFSFDSSSCGRLLKAYAEAGLTEKVGSLHTLLRQKGCFVVNEMQ